jgi:hypothetical protein
MKKYMILAAIVVLGLVTMACGISFNLPWDEIRTGPTQTEEISIPIPEETPADVKISFGAGELKLAPGAERALIEGQASYNVADFKPEIQVDGSDVRLSTGDLEITGIPRVKFDDVENTWDLQLADTPIDLEINAGAYQGDYDLGGLSINSLEISDGAADVRLEFSELNRIEMRSFRYSTGASAVKMSDLANANFSLMTFRGGAGDYTLDFNGDLQRDANVIVESGVSQVTIVVPKGTGAIVTVRGGLLNVDADSDWQISGNTYTLPGDGPKLIIEVEMGAGNLELRIR